MQKLLENNKLGVAVLSLTSTVFGGACASQRPDPISPERRERMEEKIAVDEAMRRSKVNSRLEAKVKNEIVDLLLRPVKD